MFAIVNGVFSNSLNQEWIISGFSLFLFYLTIKRTELTSEWMFAGLVFIGMAQAVYCLGQYVHWIRNIPASCFRMSGSFDNPAGFAAALVACFPFALHSIRESRWYFKLSGIVSALIIVAGTIMITMCNLS